MADTISYNGKNYEPRKEISLAAVWATQPCEDVFESACRVFIPLHGFSNPIPPIQENMDRISGTMVEYLCEKNFIEEIISQPDISLSLFPVDTKVKLLPGKHGSPQGSNNNPTMGSEYECIGTITRSAIERDWPYMVQWKDGNSNSYRRGDLVAVDM